MTLRAMKNGNDMPQCSTDWPSPERLLGDLQKAAPGSDLLSGSLNAAKSILKPYERNKVGLW